MGRHGHNHFLRGPWLRTHRERHTWERTPHQWYCLKDHPALTHEPCTPQWATAHQLKRLSAEMQGLKTREETEGHAPAQLPFPG